MTQASKQSEVYIYLLCQPQSLEPRYVGSTCDPHYRLGMHQCGTTSQRMTEWVSDLRQQKLKPEMFILEIVSASEREDREKQWIEQLLQCGTLLNKEAPGPTPRQRKAIRRAGYESIEALCLDFLNAHRRGAFAKRVDVPECTLRRWANERFTTTWEWRIRDEE